MDIEQIEIFITEARNEDLMSIHSVHKHSFQALLSGMMIKVLKLRTSESEEQLAALQRMDRFLETLTFRNCIFIFQAKILVAQDREIAILEQDKADLIKENIELKKAL